MKRRMVDEVGEDNTRHLFPPVNLKNSNTYPLRSLSSLSRKTLRWVSNQNSSASNSNSNLFNSLSRQTLEGNAAISLFSDSNPFRRKPNDSSPVPPNRQQAESGAEISGKTVPGLETSDGTSEMKKRKRKRKKDRIGDYEVEVTLSEENETEERKKSKRVNELVEGHDKEKMNEKKKRKRKRDEVEADYEAKNYGVMEQEEEKGEGGGVVGRKRKEMESLGNTMIQKDGFDDERNLLRTVFVGNLPLKIKKKLLVKEFAKFDEVESMRI